MARKAVIIGVIVLLLLAGISYAGYAVLGSPTTKAQLHVDSGIVKVNDETVTGNVKLSEKDVISTGDGKATVILYESVLISLEPLTTITLDDLTKTHPKVSQKNGQTWNMFTKLAGVVDYTISTDKAVASVRGTLFGMGDTLAVGEGTVNYQSEGKSMDVPEGNAVDDGYMRELNEPENRKIREMITKTINDLKWMRQDIMDEHKMTLAVGMKMYGITEEDIRKGFESADKGNVNVDEALAQAPMKPEWVKDIAIITKKIQALNVLMAKYE